MKEDMVARGQVQEHEAWRCRYAVERGKAFTGTEIKMQTDAGKNRGNLTVHDGGLARQCRPRAEAEVERITRALFVAMCGRDGKSINKNFRNVARGHTAPVRMLWRRLREAKATRNDAHNYPLTKALIRALDRQVDVLYGKTRQDHTGEFGPAA